MIWISSNGMLNSFLNIHCTCYIKLDRKGVNDRHKYWMSRKFLNIYKIHKMRRNWFIGTRSAPKLFSWCAGRGFLFGFSIQIRNVYGKIRLFGYKYLQAHSSKCSTFSPLQGIIHWKWMRTPLTEACIISGWMQQLS